MDNDFPPTQTSPVRPLVLGEVLFDHFPDGSKVLGGAPFNVAWNLAGFGLDPLFISAVGNDVSGAEILEHMHKWKLSTSGVETHPQHPTGAVKVSNPATDPSYEILTNRAYDFIHRPAFPLSASQYGLFYHGSLAYRETQTRGTIHYIRENSGLPVFLDINIRKPWFDPDWLPRLLHGVTWLKLNRDELAELSGQSPGGESWVHEQCTAIMERYGIPYALVTEGSDGAHFIERGGQHCFQAAGEPASFVDSVGAGDAFASVCIFGLLHGWEPQALLEHAVEFAAQVCTLKGATTFNPSFYHHEWKISQ